jgi:peptidyl-Lys metalloendopeptidase
MSSPLRRILLPSFVAAAISFPMTDLIAASTNGFTCAMHAPARVRVGATVPVTFTIRNHHNMPMYLLEWNTPFEGFLGQFLNITGPQGVLDYHGAMVKRGPPDADAYRRIKANGIAKHKANLAEVYKFDQPGTYRIEWVGKIHDAMPTKPPRAVAQFVAADLKCPAILIDVVAK